MNIKPVATIIVSGSDAVGNATNPAELYDAVSLLCHSLSLELSALKQAKSTYNRTSNMKPKMVRAVQSVPYTATESENSIEVILL